jgi:hypothetical protein
MSTLDGQTSLYTEYRGLQVPMTLEHGPVTSSGKSASGPDPRIRHRIQIGMFRPIRVDHTNCLQVVIKTDSIGPVSLSKDGNDLIWTWVDKTSKMITTSPLSS